MTPPRPDRPGGQQQVLTLISYSIIFSAQPERFNSEESVRFSEIKKPFCFLLFYLLEKAQHVENRTPGQGMLGSWELGPAP